MAQIIKHRRGSIGSLKSTTARNAELIIASGSISDLSGPFVFIGSPNSGDEGIAGAFNTVSKLYTGTNAPTITAATIAKDAPIKNPEKTLIELNPICFQREPDAKSTNVK